MKVKQQSNKFRNKAEEARGGSGGGVLSMGMGMGLGGMQQQQQQQQPAPPLPLPLLQSMGMGMHHMSCHPHITQSERRYYGPRALPPYHGRNQYEDCDDCDRYDDMDSTMQRHHALHKRRSAMMIPVAKKRKAASCKRRKIDAYYPRFIMTVLETLRDLKECNPKCDGFTLRAVVCHAIDNFVVNGDVESQVLTALRLAHMSGLVVYMAACNAYKLATPEIPNMCASFKRHARFRRRRRALAMVREGQRQECQKACMTPCPTKEPPSCPPPKDNDRDCCD